ncbi:MAG: MFS transporter, partial [SAR202 cluster bacterium]|nr:MFS transporter [SAR202 cluster bacterium]
MSLASLDRFTERFVSRRFFYGWTMVGVNFLTSMVTAGIGSYGLSFFVVPMAQALDVSRGAFSSVTLFRLLPLFLVPYLGSLADRKHGARWMLTTGGLVAGLALIATSRVSSLWQFYAAYGVVFGLANVAMGGQLVGPAILAKWFIRMRGRAMAIGTMGISAGGFLIAPLAGWLILNYGWRTAWIALGLVVILCVSPLAALLTRRQPEDIGLLPDGRKAPPQPNSGGAALAGWEDREYPWTVRQAIKTPALWLLMGVNALASLALSPVLIHQVAYIRDKGFDPSTATAVATTMALAAIVAKPPWGFLA